MRTLGKVARGLVGALALVVASAVQAAVFVIPQFTEQAGRVSTTASTYDTTMHFVYMGGLAGISGSGGAFVDVFIYDDSGVMNGASGAVCNPCSLALSTSVRKANVVVEDLFTLRGGFGGNTTRQGWAIIVVGGADPDNVQAQAFLTKSNSAANDLTIAPLEIKRLSALAYLFMNGFEALLNLV